MTTRMRNQRPRPSGAACRVLATLAATAVLWTPTQLATTSASYTDFDALSESFSATKIAAPTTLAAERTGATSVLLTWTASNSTFADGYEVYRSSASTGPWTEIAATADGSGRTTYTDDTAPADTAYYKINTYRYNWISIDSNTAQAAPA